MWTCIMCTFENGENDSQCALCAQPFVSHNVWICPKCTFHNGFQDSFCGICNHTKVDKLRVVGVLKRSEQLREDILLSSSAKSPLNKLLGSQATGRFKSDNTKNTTTNDNLMRARSNHASSEISKIVYSAPLQNVNVNVRSPLSIIDKSTISKNNANKHSFVSSSGVCLNMHDQSRSLSPTAVSSEYDWLDSVNELKSDEHTNHDANNSMTEIFHEDEPPLFVNWDETSSYHSGGGAADREYITLSSDDEGDDDEEDEEGEGSAFSEDSQDVVSDVDVEYDRFHQTTAVLDNNSSSGANGSLNNNSNSASVIGEWKNALTYDTSPQCSFPAVSEHYWSVRSLSASHSCAINFDEFTLDKGATNSNSKDFREGGVSATHSAAAMTRDFDKRQQKRLSAENRKAKGRELKASKRKKKREGGARKVREGSKKAKKEGTFVPRFMSKS